MRVRTLRTPGKLSRHFRLLEDERGAAMTETAIMLPVLILIWGGILYAFTLAQQIVEMSVRTRADAWTYSYGSCQDEPSNTDITDGQYSAASEGDTSADVPFGDRIMNLFLTQFHANRHGEATAPTQIGGATNEFHHDEAWLCNENLDNTVYNVTDMVSNIVGFDF